VYQFFCGKEKTAMADAGSGAADYPVLVITFIVGATVFVLVYISSLLKSSKGGDGSKSKGITVSAAGGSPLFKFPFQQHAQGERPS
jgi:hypothetical protein